MQRFLSTLVMGLAVALAMSACTDKADGPKTDRAADAPAKDSAASAHADKGGAVVVDKATLAAFAPLPANMNGDKKPTDAQIKLGHQLYFDVRMSKNQDIACNSCHQLDKYGVDNQPRSKGHKGQLGGRNSPSVYNAAGHIAQFWDGRAADVEEQAKGPVLNPVEMALPSAAQAEKVLKSIPGYAPLFSAAFPGEKDPITFDNFAKAIGAFERQLVTPGRWDKFLAGDTSALSDDEKKGLNTFVKTGCTTCHAGPYVGGAMYQKAGLVKPWPNTEDKGRFDVTKKEADKFFFKVPSLRNVAKTAPYFHDGATAKLSDAVKMMAEHQLGKTLGDDEVKSIVAFLGALTGELPARWIKAPAPLPSGKKTPKPDPT